MTAEIVIVGGGAGGLELATKLGRRMGRRGEARITLVDRSPTHIWKPLLHEVASGAMDSSVDQISYRAVARHRGFHFVLGEFAGLDREAQTITLNAIVDDNGQTILPERQLSYDYLVLALGGITNDFGIPGVSRHCQFLDSPDEAQNFHQTFLNTLMRVNSERRTNPDACAHIPIVGGGATGVELAAELVYAAETVHEYGFSQADRSMLHITLLEAGPRLLPALPERISRDTLRELKELGVDVRLEARITEASADALVDQHGHEFHGDIMVWAAGVQGPALMEQLDGLTLQPNRMLKVAATLQSVDDPHIFALGDCAACPQEQGFVPPRAQSAHQMADHVVGNLRRALDGRELKAFQYQDYGSLVNLSQYSAVGTLMGGTSKGSLRVEGRLARLVYISLYRMHQVAVFGWFRGLLMAFTDRLHRAFKPKMKLH
ncbi:NAD(P)/FAD-dependent oxidoreductase [Salicola sp. Rm-C-2C1-2]|uniref:NAD(P)/FAD-dependent oxidoreductase n=1 Tax=Salicola sp. Rm-C-2C1-2 TaxID=3141321 RepID=UPI0032E487BD